MNSKFSLSIWKMQNAIFSFFPSYSSSHQCRKIQVQLKIIPFTPFNYLYFKTRRNENFLILLLSFKAQYFYWNNHLFGGSFYSHQKMLKLSKKIRWIRGFHFQSLFLLINLLNKFLIFSYFLCKYVYIHNDYFYSKIDWYT